MRKDLRFKKEEGVWYIDLPNWIGPKHSLSMVAGADNLLDLYNMYSIKKNDIVELKINTISKLKPSAKGPHPKGAGDLYLRKIESSTFGGATYKTGIKEVPTIWLCPVTLFVLHEYPDVIGIECEWHEFMNPSFYYFTYDNIPGTGPAREKKLGDFDDFQRELDNLCEINEDIKEGMSISEIAALYELPEEKVKEYILDIHNN